MQKQKKNAEERAQIWLLAPDLHWPKTHRPTWNALMDFLAQNHKKVEGFVFQGDQFDNECISHHTKGKPLYRPQHSFKRATDSFLKKVFNPLNVILDANYIRKVWFVGNHDRFEHDLIEEQPELDGIIERVEILELAKKGWSVVPLGGRLKLGKLNVIHGEILSGVGNQAGTFPSKRAVALYAGNVVAGHTHSPQMYTQVSPADQTQKWQGYILPILGATNPGYLRNRPTAWVNGFGIVELRSNGRFNLYPVVVIDGEFSFGGKVYGKNNQVNRSQCLR